MNENDILIENTDVSIKDYDFDVQNCNNQNIKHLIIATPGNYVISPKVGASIYTMQNIATVDPRMIFAKIADELKKDGYKYPYFNGTAGAESTELEVTAVRIKSPQTTKI